VVTANDDLAGGERMVVPPDARRLPLAEARRYPKGITSITDVAERQLCTGCGACAFVQPDDISMVDDIDAGRRPLVTPGVSTDAALRVCPGIGLEHGPPPPGADPGLLRSWGPVLELWEGHAGDQVIRVAGSSGGAATALALCAIEAQGFHGVLHIRARRDVPYLNETVMSLDRAALLAGSGSRYAPASPCDRLDLIRAASAPSVLVGKPCDVAAAARAATYDVELQAKLGLTIAIFCAGTPTLRGTFEMLRWMGFEDPDEVGSLRYRGNGWPGDAHASAAPGGTARDARLSYEESWGRILQRHRQWRCYVCADHTGEFADIAVGDPWYRDPAEDDLGSNLIVVRTEAGRRLLRAALREGYITARPVAAPFLPASQPGLRRVRGAVWGRMWASRLAGVPTPIYRRMPMFRAWLFELTPKERLQSTLGLVRRLGRRGLLRRHPVRAWHPPTRHENGEG
jgi:coenzyme F420 hydrogenase subunit beta